MDYTLIRSSRRTLAIQIDREWSLVVRAPRLYPVYLIERFIEAKKTWIETHKRKVVDRKEKTERKIYSETEIREMKRKLMEYLIHRVPELWEWRWLPKYTNIKITKSERRWWSCSGKNWLCFSYRLSEHLTENTAFIDAVIVHELAHLREKHHQPKFWKLVYEMMPEYEMIMKNHKTLD
jgi:predicted metal-dependent hydrolase